VSCWRKGQEAPRNAWGEVILGLLMILSSHGCASSAFEDQVSLCTGKDKLTTLLLLCACTAGGDHTDTKNLHLLT